MNAKVTALASPVDMLINTIRTNLVLIQEGKNDQNKGRRKWIEGTMGLGKALAEGRAARDSNNAFSDWLDDHGFKDSINHQDRSALIKFGEYPELAREVLESTLRDSWQHIYEQEMKPRLVAETELNAADRFTHVSKTTPPLPATEGPVHIPKNSPLHGWKLAGEILPFYHTKNGGTIFRKVTGKGTAGYKENRELFEIAFNEGLLIKNSVKSEPVNLRLLLPQATDHRYCADFRLDKPKDRTKIRDLVFPAVIERKDEYLSDPSVLKSIVTDYVRNKQQAALANASAVQEPVRLVASDGAGRIVVYGAQLWPRVDNRFGQYDYDQVRTAVWYFRDMRNWFENTPNMGKSHGSWAIYIRLSVKRFRDYMIHSRDDTSRINYVFRLVDAFCSLYEDNPTGECVVPPSPTNDGHW